MQTTKYPDAYIAQGYKNRAAYLSDLSDEYGEAVYMLSDLLGPSEDFDGLITALEDYEMEGF